MKALLYCTKGKDYLYKTNFVKIEDIKKGCLDKLVYETDKNERLYLDGDKRENLNGKIVAEVEIDKVEEIDNGSRFNDEGRYYVTNYMSYGMVLEKSCLTDKELEKYLQEDIGYALHLTNLKVFDEPKELSEYYLFDPDYCILKEIKKAPQNMCRVVESRGLIEVPSNEYILISIQPQHLCNILNGKKTIEVRRKVLNCLKEMI